MSSPSAPIVSPPAIITPVPSEDIVAKKFDTCAADFIVNTGIGFSVGVVASVILFRRRAWPVALSTGFGAGVAYQNCNIAFNPYSLPGTRILPAAAPVGK